MSDIGFTQFILPENLSTKADITTSAVIQGYEGKYAIDNNIYTSCKLDSTDPDKFLIIDLKNNYTIQHISFLFNTSMRHFEIYDYSNDSQGVQLDVFDTNKQNIMEWEVELNREMSKLQITNIEAYWTDEDIEIQDIIINKENTIEPPEGYYFRDIYIESESY